MIWDESLLYPFREFLDKPDQRNLQNLIDEAHENFIDASDQEIEYLLSYEYIAGSLMDQELDFRINGERFYDD